MNNKLSTAISQVSNEPRVCSTSHKKFSKTLTFILLRVLANRREKVVWKSSTARGQPRIVFTFYFPIAKEKPRISTGLLSKAYIASAIRQRISSSATSIAYSKFSAFAT